MGESSSKMALGNEVVAKNDPEEEPEAEEEEEEDEPDLIDPVDAIREECETTPSPVQLAERLATCNERVSSRKQTEETCHEEMLDWVNSVDQCVSKTLFNKLK